MTLALPRRALAAPELKVDIGWGDRFRPGRWTPVTVRASDDLTRSAVLELNVPQPDAGTMRVRQFFTISPRPTTLQLYAPLRGSQGPVVLIREADTGRTIARYPEDSDKEQARYPRRVVGGATCFVGVTGSLTRLENLAGRFAGGPMADGYLPPHLLPDEACGYDGLDLLVLNRPDLSHLDAARQTAVLDWALRRRDGPALARRRSRAGGLAPGQRPPVPRRPVARLRVGRRRPGRLSPPRLLHRLPRVRIDSRPGPSRSPSSAARPASRARAATGWAGSS